PPGTHLCRRPFSERAAARISTGGRSRTPGLCVQGEGLQNDRKDLQKGKIQDPLGLQTKIRTLAKPKTRQATHDRSTQSDKDLRSANRSEHRRIANPKRT